MQVTDPRSRALDLCFEAALAQGSLGLALRDYERRTGVSARMLVHHFGDKAGLEAALLEEVERRLLAEVMQALQQLGASPLEVAKAFSAAERKQLRALLRLLVGRGFSGDARALAVLRKERDTWRAALRGYAVSEEETDQILFTLVGGAFDAMLADEVG